MEIINGVDQEDVNVTDIDHNDLDGLNVGDYKHLTLANYTDLTDNGVCSIHKHDIVEDLTPQIGGNLDMQTSKLVGEGGSTGIYIDSNGHVGMGTITPQNELDVNGKIAINGTSIVHLPDQTDFPGTMYLGNGDGGADLSNGEASNGAYNTFIGAGSGDKNTTGSNNVATGYGSLVANTTGYRNVANGMYSLVANTTGYRNISDGMYSLSLNTTGHDNTASGYGSLYSNTTGQKNTAHGMYCLFDIGAAQTAGAFNIGTSYIIKTTGDTDFTLIGAADSNVGTVFTSTGVGVGTGTATPNETNNNTAVGHSSGKGIVYGKANTVIGANVVGLSAGLSNNVIIADGDGNKRINVDENGDVGIGTTTPTAKLDVNSNVLRLRTAKTPATAGADGNQGDIAWDTGYIYVCTATNTWKRSSLSTW